MEQQTQELTVYDFTENTSRRLATVRKVADITPISGADNIVLATIDGWQCVISKNDGLSVGDLCVYFEIDSVVPSDNPIFAFLEPRGYKVKTIRLRKQISQGFAMPLKWFPEVTPELGLDVTDLLKVTKIVPKGYKALAGFAKGLFPSFIPKTDEERIQNCYNTVAPYFGEKWVATEKLDGSSMTMYIKDGVFGVCSRNLELKCDDSNAGNAFVAYAMSCNMQQDFEVVAEGDSTPDNFAVQGELIGPGIQGNRYELEKTRFYGFNVWDIDRQCYLNYADARLIMGLLSIFPVDEVLYNSDLLDPNNHEDEILLNVKDLVTMATRKSVLNNKVWMEGLVFRPMIEKEVHRHGRLSFKVINPEFLLKEKD